MIRLTTPEELQIQGHDLSEQLFEDQYKLIDYLRLFVADGIAEIDRPSDLVNRYRHGRTRS